MNHYKTTTETHCRPGTHKGRPYSRQNTNTEQTRNPQLVTRNP